MTENLRASAFTIERIWRKHTTQQIINLIFFKIHDERFTNPEVTVKFCAGFSDNPGDAVRSDCEFKRYSITLK